MTAVQEPVVAWAVEYRDGAQVQRFNADRTETPWASIRWTDVVSVAFASEQATAEFAFAHPGDGFDVRLMSRVTRAASGAGGVRAFLVVTSRAGAEISDESVADMLYWFPDGAYHHCRHYNCPDAARHAMHLAHGTPGAPLAPYHDAPAA